MYEVLQESIDLAALDQGGVDLIAVARDRLSVEMGRKVIRERKVKPKSKGKAIPWFCTLDISQNRLGQIPPSRPGHAQRDCPPAGGTGLSLEPDQCMAL